MMPSADARTAVGNTSFSSGPMQPQLPSPKPTSRRTTHDPNGHRPDAAPPAPPSPARGRRRPPDVTREETGRAGRRAKKAREKPNGADPPHAPTRNWPSGLDTERTSDPLRLA